MRVGVLGTMVWDTIHARDGRSVPIEEWGGISYALAAASAAALPGDVIVPIIRVGADLADRAFDFFRTLPSVDLTTGIRVVAEPNNRVELRYQDSQRRFEKLSGGIGPWNWAELAPIVTTCDALYVNLISGFELDLLTALALRAGFDGPIYCDLHSLMLGVGPDGTRIPRPLEQWREWLRCFDAVQVNEDELGMLAEAWGDPWRFAGQIVGTMPRLLLVTLGDRGSAYFASPAFTSDPMGWERTRVVPPVENAQQGAVRTQRIPPDLVPREGDPTGCGDVWGATLFFALLESLELDDAMKRANAAAARNVQHRGASGLHHHLQGRIGT